MFEYVMELETQWRLCRSGVCVSLHLRQAHSLFVLILRSSTRQCSQSLLWQRVERVASRAISLGKDLVNDGFTLIQLAMILAKKNAGHLPSLIDLFTVLFLEKVCFNDLANNTSIFILPFEREDSFFPHGPFLCHNSTFSDLSLQSRLL